MKKARIWFGILVAILSIGPVTVMAEDVELKHTAIDGSPGHAFAGHKARVSAIARHFALTHPLNVAGGTATEDNTIELIAHLQAAADYPAFATPIQEPSRILAPSTARRKSVTSFRL